MAPVHHHALVYVHTLNICPPLERRVRTVAGYPAHLSDVPKVKLKTRCQGQTQPAGIPAQSGDKAPESLAANALYLHKGADNPINRQRQRRKLTKDFWSKIFFYSIIAGSIFCKCFSQ